MEEFALGSCWQRGQVFSLERHATPKTDKGYSVSNRERINWQGLAAHDVERARQEFHVDGSGVKVCVISDFVDLNKAKHITPKGVKVLPGQSGVQADNPDEGKVKHKDEGEGTAMLEIVHSIAPGAELMFAPGNSAKEMIQNIRALGNSRCHIIVDDKEFYTQSPFQDDIISRAVNEVTAKDILYITSAGNRGNTRAGTSAAWEGYFRAGRVLRDPRGTPIRIMHVFADKQDGEYNDVLGECGRDGGEVHVVLFWNDPMKEGDNQAADLSDYELWAINSNGVLKDKEENYVTTAHSYKTQSCQDNKNGNDKDGRCVDDKHPCRHICFPAPNGTDSNRTSIVITKVAGKGDRFLHLDFYVRHSENKNGCRLERQTGGMISGHHGAASAFSVASKSPRDSALDTGTGVFIGGPTEHVKKYQC